MQGDGSIRIPSTNLSPTVLVTAPTNGAAVRDDDVVRFQLQPTDVDGFIERVEFFLDGTKVGGKTNAPFSLLLTNVGVGTHWLQATVFDDDGGGVISTPVSFHVRTRLNSTISPDGLVLEFLAAENTSYTLQMTHDLITASWSNVLSFASGSARIIRYTNNLPAPSATSFYRVISP